MGVVYHAHYVDYFEAARTEALREMGLPYRDLETMGIIMPVVEVGVRYHRPANYDDLLVVETSFESIPEFRFPIDYRIRRDDQDNLLVSGRVTLCFVDRKRNRPVRCPDVLRSVFENVLPGH
jgi:acyl-CoA thioester hydrolase